MSRSELIQKAKLARQARRYEDMATFMKAAAEQGGALSAEERGLLWAACRRLAASRRAACRVIASSEREAGAPEQKLRVAKGYRAAVESELRGICAAVLELLDRYLLAQATDPESKVFYLKMKGDYCRYLAEVALGDDRKQMIDRTQGAYQEAMEISKKELQPAHPLHLGLARNFSIFYYEILHDAQLACALAKAAFGEAVAELQKLKDPHKDSILILQLLRDNLILWTPNGAGEECDAPEGATI